MSSKSVYVCTLCSQSLYQRRPWRSVLWRTEQYLQILTMFFKWKNVHPRDCDTVVIEFKQWETCIIAVVFNALCGIELMLLTHHTFLIVLSWAVSPTLFYLILQMFALMKVSQNEAYWPIWVAIFISLVQGANHLNISLRKYRHIHFLTCQHSIEKLWHWCLFQLPPSHHAC